MRRSLTSATVSLAVLSACGPGEIFVTRSGDVTAKVATSDNREGVPCTVTHTSFGDEETEAPTPVASGHDVTRRVAFGTQLRLPAPFKPRIALVVRCPGYERAASPEREVDIGWLSTPRTNVGTVVVQLR